MRWPECFIEADERLRDRLSGQSDGTRGAVAGTLMLMDFVAAHEAEARRIEDRLAQGTKPERNDKAG
jgi:hypothetical protein